MSELEKIRRRLQVHMAVLASLGTLLLGMGQESALLPVLATGSAICSVVFTDRLQWFSMNRSLANLTALGAVAFALRDFFTNGGEQQLLAIANLLIYLQVILLFQKKNHRVYWQLAVLSLLQVVVAAALNLGVEFGALLGVYLLVAIATLTLFFAYREATRLAAAAGNDHARQAQGATAWQLLRGAPPSGPLHPVVLPGEPDTLPSGALARPVLGITIAAMLLSCLFFFAVPRLGTARWQGPRGGDQRMIGFSRDVSLDRTARIYESRDLAFRVAFRDPATGEPVRIHGEPYFRGTALTRYSFGKWREGFGDPGRPVSLLQREPSGRQVLQSYTLEPTRESILFAVAPSYSAGEGSEHVIWYRGLERLQRESIFEGVVGQFDYDVSTDAFENGWQSPWYPFPLERFRFGQWGEITGRDDRPILNDVAAVTERVLEERGLLEAGPYRVARGLEEYLRASGEFEYRLEFDPPSRDLNEGESPLDPVVRFLTVDRQGHCEYFASALVLMLRSRGIPARLVLGYRGGDFNSIGDYYLVHQHRAHAWAEVYLRHEETPDSVRNSRRLAGGGCWYRLDPTPGTEEEELDFTASLLAQVGEWLDYVQLLWEDYVLGLNSERQQKSIYQPVLERLTNVVEGLFEADTWRQIPARLRVLLGWNMSGWLDGYWFNWQAGFAAMVLAACAYSLVGGVRRFLTWWRGGVGGARKTRRGGHAIDFYLRWEQLLARHGLRRGDNQTPREFAAAIGGQFHESPGLQELAAIPRLLAEAFYQLRYGKKPLSEQQRLEVEAAMRRTADALTKRPVSP